MRTSEYELVQNVVLGAQALRVFTKTFVRYSPVSVGPTLLHLLPILPISFNEKSVNALCRRRFDGGLDNALIENRSLFLGLQSRMQQMLDQTISALNVAVAAKLLTYDASVHEFYPPPRILVRVPSNEEARRICGTAARLGYWSANLSLSEFSHKIGIVF